MLLDKIITMPFQEREMKSTLSEFTRAFFYKNIYIIYTFLFFYLYPSQINQLTIVFLSRKIFSGIQLSCILSINQLDMRYGPTSSIN